MQAPGGPTAALPPSRSKTIATWLALLGGPLGLQRLYLHGWRDLLAWACWIPTLMGVWGIWRARTLGLDDRLGWVLMPWLGLIIVLSTIDALRHGLRSPESWNTSHNPALPMTHRAGNTTWITVIALVAAALVGATALIATIVFVAQHSFVALGP